MIDIQDDIFFAIKNALTAIYPKISVTNDGSNTPSSFPHVTVVEENNSVYTPMRSHNLENYADLTYDINVYSDKQNGRKAECESIMNIIDNTLSELNFTRRIKRPIPNTADPTLYRITARYTVITDRNKNLYQN